jgi:hypothetical protein
MTLLAAFALRANASEVVRASHWELHSSFWMSLHQTLMAEAAEKPRDLAGLTAEEQAAWNEAVAAYKAAGGKGDMTFTSPMVITNDGITQIADDAIDPIFDVPMAEALKRAAPVYRAHWWAGDDRANRFFIGYAAALLRDAGPELARAHEIVYRTKFPPLMRVYISPYAGQYGAYTIRARSGWMTTMSSRDEGYQGLHALEMILHESSHIIVNPNRGTVGEAIAASAKKRGIQQPRDLWHALLFMTSSELTRRLLAERGTIGFVPSSEDLFTRVWPRYRAAVDKHWLPYLDGKGTLEEAIDRIVADIKN